jgi:hypothetical protein
MFSLYLRYQTAHHRAFHKSLNGLLKLRAEKRKAEIGFEAQERKNEDQRIKTEQHEMTKQTHYWDVLFKDAKACHQITLNGVQNRDAARQHPGFEAQIAADLAKLGLQREAFQVATPAA